jgi:hypothetical protein
MTPDQSAAFGRRRLRLRTSGRNAPPIAAPPIKVAVDLRKSLRFIFKLPMDLRQPRVFS